MSLNLFLDYSSSEEENEETPMIVCTEKVKEKKIENVEYEVSKIVRNMVKKVEKLYEFRTFSSSESEDEDDVDDITSMWSYESYSDDDDDGTEFRRQKRCLTKGELGLEDLPRIERLQITVPAQRLTQIGTVQSILNPLVVVQTFRNTPPLDLDSVLFTKSGHALGQIFDVMGQVQQPLYVLRFNDPSEIEQAAIAVGSPIYYVEHEAPLTKYVFVKDLLKEKGCDASWKHNNEVPPEEQEYSDDEQERKQKSKAGKRRQSGRRPQNRTQT